MVKKMRLFISSMFKKRETEQHQPNKTLRDTFKTSEDGTETPESWFTRSPESGSFSTESEEEWLETAMRSERLFFEPGRSSSILEEKKGNGSSLLFEESVVLAMESRDPYGDFRRSMEEMVMIHGLKDWECLLRWYLKVNGKRNHGLIVGAFVDLLLALSGSHSALFQGKDEEQGYIEGCECDDFCK